MRIFSAESLRIPGEGFSTQGEAGPKPRSKDVGDGQPVQIPAPHISVMSDGVTQEVGPSALMVRGQGGRGLVSEMLTGINPES